MEEKTIFYDLVIPHFILPALLKLTDREAAQLIRAAAEYTLTGETADMLPPRGEKAAALYDVFLSWARDAAAVSE